MIYIKQLEDKLGNGISVEFGYYPCRCDIKTDRFSIQTLSGYENAVKDIKNDSKVIKLWIYPGPQLYKDFMGIRSMPYSARIFDLPKTHVLTLYESDRQEDLDFVVWCLSFFTGMRLTTKKNGFLDATPISPGKLVDFLHVTPMVPSLSNRGTVADVIDVALGYLEAEKDDLRAPKRVAAVIHVLFLAQYPHNLPFEQFLYLYMALDGCFALVAAKEKPKPSISHAGRVQWMCEKFGIALPDWGKNAKTAPSPLSSFRNDIFHEALFFGEPLGFSVYGGNQPAVNQGNVLLEMRALVCRLLVAILGKSEISYVKTPIDTRGRYMLELTK